MDLPAKHYPIAIIGSGPAAYSAAAYCENSVLFEGSYTSLIGPGGQLTTTSDVDNYPGFVMGTDGPALMERMRVNCQSFIVEDEIVSIGKKDGTFTLYTSELMDFLKKSNVDTENSSRANVKAPFSGETYEENTNYGKITSDKTHLSQHRGDFMIPNEAVPVFEGCDRPKDYQSYGNLANQTGSEKDPKGSKSDSSHNSDSQQQLGIQNEVGISEKYSIIDHSVQKNEQHTTYSLSTVSSKHGITAPCLFTADIVIIATGATARRLYVPGTHDNEFWQKGISTCAVCDGYGFLNKRVIVIGGGDSALEEALYLANIASEVVLVHRSKNFRARSDMLEKARKHAKINILTDIVLIRAYGDTSLRGCIFKGETEVDIPTDGLFFAIGHIPNTGFLRCEKTNEFLVDVDKDGFIITDTEQKTSRRGILAAGDVQDKVYRQAITAAASGARAGITAMKILTNKTTQ